MESELTVSITKAVLSRVQHQVARPAADSYINDIKKNITEELKNIHEDIQSSISSKPRVYGNWDNRPDGVGKRIADIFRIRDERAETAKRLLQTEIIEQRLAFESMGINTGNIDTNYVMGDLDEGGQALAGTSEKDKTRKQKQPTRAPRPYDYSLLLAQKTDQELVQLNKQSLEYLKYFFEVSEKKTQIYDVTRSTAHIIEKPKSTIGYILNELFGIYSAEGAIPLAIPAIAATSEALTYGTGILLGGIVVNKVVEDYNKYRELLGSWGNDTSYANDVQRYTKLASSTTRDVTITSADYVLANSRGVFDLDNSQDMESLKHIARGIAIERTSQQNSLRTTELPVMDFKVMGRVDPQGYGNIVSAYFDIDPNAGKPKVLSTPIPYQPKSILFTPDDRDSHLEWSKLPGFTPHVLDLKDLQEGRDVHETHWKDSILLRGKSDEQIVKELTDNTIVDLLGKLPEIEGGQVNHIGLKLQEAFEQMYNEPKHENTVIAGVGSPESINDI